MINDYQDDQKKMLASAHANLKKVIEREDNKKIDWTENSERSLCEEIDAALDGLYKVTGISYSQNRHEKRHNVIDVMIDGFRFEIKVTRILE